MKKIIYIIIMGIISIGGAVSQTSVWKISNGKKNIYLAGSVHLLRKSDFPLPEEFNAAFSKSEISVFEADVQNPMVALKFLKESKLPEDQKLKDVLSKNTYEKLCRFAEKSGIEMEQIETLKPGVAVMAMETQLMKEKDIITGGVDLFFLQKAKEKSKKIDFLESIDFQINLICNPPFPSEEFVEYAISESDKTNYGDFFDKIIKDWRKGIPMAEKEVSEMKTKFPNVYKAMFTDRNKKWMKIIESYLKDDRVRFVIVGAGHLWGDDGLLNLLEKKGYKIGQLRMKNKK